VAGGSLFADDPDEQIAQGRLAVSLAQRTGNLTVLSIASFALGVALRHRHPEEALAAFEQVVVLVRRGANPGVVLPARCFAAQLAAALGDADGATTRLKDVLDEALRDDEEYVMAMSLDVAVDILSYRGESRAAAALAAAVETTLDPQRFPDFSHRGPALALRTANLARARQELGDSPYEQARAEAPP
jgi:hypothetical protein